MICGCTECNQRLDNNMENEEKPKQDRKPSIVIDCDDSETNSLTNSLPVGNATGSGRTRVVLKPGHSLMDWIKLTAKSTNLSGTNGQIIAVSMEELEKHKTRDDCWICVRGKVYNVTHYLDFHPGGVEEMMRGAGSDATELFNEIHRYVNYESMLKKCFVGPLINNS